MATAILDIRQVNVSNIRRCLTLIEFELMESEPNEERIKTNVEIIQVNIQKGFDND